jgi:hypothetical protein
MNEGLQYIGDEQISLLVAHGVSVGQLVSGRPRWQHEISLTAGCVSAIFIEECP